MAFQTLFQELPVANVSSVSNEYPLHPCPRARRNKTRDLGFKEPIYHLMQKLKQACFLAAIRKHSLLCFLIESTWFLSITALVVWCYAHFWSKLMIEFSLCSSFFKLLIRIPSAEALLPIVFLSAFSKEQLAHKVTVCRQKFWTWN